MCQNTFTVVVDMHKSFTHVCSAHNHDLFKKIISDTPLCRCGSVENTHHFLFQCPFNNIVRNNLLHKVSNLHEVSLNPKLSKNFKKQGPLNILKTNCFSSN